MKNFGLGFIVAIFTVILFGYFIFIDTIHIGSKMKITIKNGKEYNELFVNDFLSKISYHPPYKLSIDDSTDRYLLGHIAGWYSIIEANDFMGGKYEQAVISYEFPPVDYEYIKGFQQGQNDFWEQIEYCDIDFDDRITLTVGEYLRAVKKLYENTPIKN